MPIIIRYFLILILLALASAGVAGQTARTAKAEKGSETAKAGFRNEGEIAAKFNAWKDDADARDWLKAMGHDPEKLISVVATRPSGKKADVMVELRTADKAVKEGISIKLVSSERGFNQIDKRWLRQYAAMWDMPSDILAPLRSYCGEIKPTGKSRDPKRMFITEFDKPTQEAIVRFFTENKEKIISGLLRGEGETDADHFMVAWKNADKPRWKIVHTDDAIRFFGEGDVAVTRAGNLRIGRISMQRKGGDGGRETANMLQFKLNPAAIFEMK